MGKNKKDAGAPKELHGNNAKVAPNKKIEGAYVTNTVTMSNKKNCKTPIVQQSNVEYARKFAEENKK